MIWRFRWTTTPGVCSLVAVLASLTWQPAGAAPPSTRPADGLRENTPEIHALVGGRIVTALGRSIERGTILLRDGVIVAVGEDVDVPPEAQVVNCTGKTIYPGFIDSYSELEAAEPDEAVPALAPRKAAGYWNPRVRPHVRAEQSYLPYEELNRKLRSQGIVARLAAPTGAVIQGTSCLVNTASGEGLPTVVQSRVALHLRLKPPRRGYHVGYPTSPMGAVALVRQAFYDARWYDQALRLAEQRSGTPRPEPSVELEALSRYQRKALPVIIDAPDELYCLRADQVAREFQLKAIVRGSGEEYQQLDAVAATGRAVIVPLDFPPPPEISSPEAALNVSLHRLLHWDLAPENPGRLAAAGVRIALTTHDLPEPTDFLKSLRVAVRRGLTAEAALRALSITPAELFDVSDRLGTIEQGKAASLVVTDGELFEPNTKVLETWVTGRRYVADSEPPFSGPLDKELSAEEAANEKKRREDGSSEEPARLPDRALYDVNYPLGAFGRSTPQPPEAATVLFRNVTVWTSGEQGSLPGHSVLIRDGKIAAVAREIEPPDGAMVIDCGGKHLTPGLIDCHSHMATDGGLTEAGRTTAGEVRIGDFVDNEDVDIYRQLAGGVTTVNVLPGSDTTIGGQSQVIKLRWGGLPEQMKFAGAAPGMKFALGENVKQSNWGDEFKTRYPQTRMGVEQLVLDSFRAADHYRRQWQRWRQRPEGLPPRVDLELEALVEVLEGRRSVHCHAYRQDETLAFLRTCSALGVRVGTLHHVLEGYKVADVLAQEQVAASTFSDWWAFKVEAFDAIPFNGAMLHRAGVLTSFNSDSPELARRLNTEAAKAVKYGGLSPNEALRFVTLNPARQLGVDQYVGSIEVGKDADLALWNGSPLSTLSLCEQTWIDGRLYFDRQQDLQQRAKEAGMKAALIQRVLEQKHAAD